MLYDYQYDIAAMLITIIFLILYAMRRSLKTRSKRIFLAVILCDFLAAACDAASCFTISYPDKYPFWFNYAVTLGFLFFFNMMSVAYFVYISAKADSLYAKAGKVHGLGQYYLQLRNHIFFSKDPLGSIF